MVDEHGSEVDADGEQMGEVQLRGDYIVGRYFGDLGENSTSWAEGWFKTGDVATVSPDGFITLVDRLKDIIISGGTNVASREVEEVLLEMAGVREVAVVGNARPQVGRSRYGGRGTF